MDFFNGIGCCAKCNRRVCDEINKRDAQLAAANAQRDELLREAKHAEAFVWGEEGVAMLERKVPSQEWVREFHNRRDALRLAIANAERAQGQGGAVSGTDSSHSAASAARSEDGSAEQRAEPDPEVLRVRAPAGAPAGGEQAGGRLGAGDGGEAAAGAGAVGGSAEAARGEGLPLPSGPVGENQAIPDEVAGTPATSDDRGGPDDGAPPAPPAVEAGGGGVFGLDLVAHLYRQRDFSLRTFGPGLRSAGVVDHIRKELIEIEAAPSDLAEWIDVVILAFDGAWRIGATPEQIVAALRAKQAKNEARSWPDWRKADPSKAIEHDRSQDAGGGA